jgi:hypothetical protein
MKKVRIRSAVLEQRLFSKVKIDRRRDDLAAIAGRNGQAVTRRKDVFEDLFEKAPRLGREAMPLSRQAVQTTERCQGGPGRADIYGDPFLDRFLDVPPIARPETREEILLIPGEGDLMAVITFPRGWTVFIIIRGSPFDVSPSCLLPVIDAHIDGLSKGLPIEKIGGALVSKGEGNTPFARPNALDLHQGQGQIQATILGGRAIERLIAIAIFEYSRPE